MKFFSKRKKTKEKPQKDKKAFNNSIFGDKEERTKKTSKSYLVFIFSIIFIIVGIVNMPNSYSEYNYFLEHNTTPVGTELMFKKTNASLTFKGVWTDKNRDLTVVRIGYPGNSRNILSASGINYGLSLMVDEEKDIPEDLKMSYGLLGTDGDGFLFLKGNLKEKAYQVLLANRSNLELNSTKDIKKIQKSEEESLTKIVANQSFTNMDKNGIVEIIFKEDAELDNEKDNVNFRINPYSENTNVYDGSFLKEDGSIDYVKVINETGFSDLVEKTTEQIELVEENIEIYKNAIKEFDSRLQQNPGDNLAITSKETKVKDLEAEEELLEELKGNLDLYKNNNLDKKSFGEMQTEFLYKTVKGSKVTSVSSNGEKRVIE